MVLRKMHLVALWTYLWERKRVRKITTWLTAGVYFIFASWEVGSSFRSMILFGTLDFFGSISSTSCYCVWLCFFAMIKALFAVFSPSHVQGGENITQATVKMVAAASSNFIYITCLRRIFHLHQECQFLSSFLVSAKICASNRLRIHAK